MDKTILIGDVAGQEGPYPNPITLDSAVPGDRLIFTNKLNKVVYILGLNDSPVAGSGTALSSQSAAKLAPAGDATSSLTVSVPIGAAGTYEYSVAVYSDQPRIIIDSAGSTGGSTSPPPTDPNSGDESSQTSPTNDPNSPNDPPSSTG